MKTLSLYYDMTSRVVSHRQVSIRGHFLTVRRVFQYVRRPERIGIVTKRSCSRSGNGYLRMYDRESASYDDVLSSVKGFVNDALVVVMVSFCCFTFV